MNSKPVVEERHLEAVPYEESDRVEAPDWYDDTINVGDTANALDLADEDGDGYKHDASRDPLPDPDGGDGT